MSSNYCCDMHARVSVSQFHRITASASPMSLRVSSQTAPILRCLSAARALADRVPTAAIGGRAQQYWLLPAVREINYTFAGHNIHSFTARAVMPREKLMH